MSVAADETTKTRLRVERAADGTRKVIETDADDRPRPIDDDALKAVAGGGRYLVEFHDGCSIEVGGPSINSHSAAATEAQSVHTSLLGHTNNNCNVTQL